MVFVTLLASTITALASPFDGTWILRRSHTTPRGLHNEGSDTLVINTAGTSTETLDQVVTMRSAASAGPIRIVQIRRSVRTTIGSEALTIHWSALQLIKARSGSIPPGLHVAVGPATATYTIRQGKLFATFGTDTDVFTRAK